MKLQIDEMQIARAWRVTKQEIPYKEECSNAFRSGFIEGFKDALDRLEKIVKAAEIRSSEVGQDI